MADQPRHLRDHLLLRADLAALRHAIHARVHLVEPLRHLAGNAALGAVDERHEVGVDVHHPVGERRRAAPRDDDVQAVTTPGDGDVAEPVRLVQA
uniref:Uncharacterized protein n=1 Tax=Oryza brachyantha TaxID=4533 RepID=J3NF02_ORYBR